MSLLEILGQSRIKIGLKHVSNVRAYKILTERTYVDELCLVGELRALAPAAIDMAETQMWLETDAAAQTRVQTFVTAFAARWGADASVVWTDPVCIARVITHLADVVHHR